MHFPLFPTYKTSAVTDITPQMLRHKRIFLLMLDFDNTIVPYTTNAPTDKMANWLWEMVESDISVCVVSNSKRDRVKVFCEAYGLNCITHAKKPFSRGIKECLAQYDLPAEQCALAGDQIYTDVLGANCCGVHSILVKAIHNHNFWLKARHVLELPWILLAGKRSFDE
jgi:HAD superfamily phosphatase (TIGR01668 family)